METTQYHLYRTLYTQEPVVGILVMVIISANHSDLYFVMTGFCTSRTRIAVNRSLFPHYLYSVEYMHPAPFLSCYPNAEFQWNANIQDCIEGSLR